MNNLIWSIPIWLWIALVTFGVVMGTVAYLILLERKVASWVQDRVGPNRVGPGGLLQPMADGLKFFVKEDYRPGGVDRVLFSIAPATMIILMILSVAVLPWGGVLQQSRTFTLPAHSAVSPDQAAADAAPWGAQIVGVQPAGPGQYTVQFQQAFQIADLNIGVLFILAVLSLAVYGVVIGGWASNNKYSFLGGLRATANMISYEIPLGLTVLTVVILFGTLNLGQIVQDQAHYWAGWIPAWNVFAQPLAFVMFLVCIHAEANRAPFDLAEAEQELVGGYHTEYSSMRFALYFLAEYAGMITTSAVCVALFFGGWHLPWIEWAWPALGGNVNAANPSITTSVLACIVRAVVFFTKTVGVIFIFMWVRWSLPRFRFDQLMMIAWRGLIPVSLVLLMGTAALVYRFGPADQAWKQTGRMGGWLALYLLLMNLALLVATMLISMVLPPAPKTNRKLAVIGSRFTTTSLPAWESPAP